MPRLCSDSSRSYPGRSARRGGFGKHIVLYPVKRPAGATGKPSPGDFRESDPPVVAPRNKGSCTGYHRHMLTKVAPDGETHKVIRQKSAEAIVAQGPE